MSWQWLNGWMGLTTTWCAREVNVSYGWVRSVEHPRINHHKTKTSAAENPHHIFSHLFTSSNEKGWNFSSQLKLLLGKGLAVGDLEELFVPFVTSQRVNCHQRSNGTVVPDSCPPPYAKANRTFSFTAEWTGSTVTNSSKVVAAQPEFILSIISQWCNPFFGLCLHGEYKRGFSADVLLTVRKSWTGRKRCCSALQSIPLLLFFKVRTMGNVRLVVSA